MNDKKFVGTGKGLFLSVKGNEFDLGKRFAICPLNWPPNPNPSPNPEFHSVTTTGLGSTTHCFSFSLPAIGFFKPFSPLFSIPFLLPFNNKHEPTFYLRWNNPLLFFMDHIALLRVKICYYGLFSINTGYWWFYRSAANFWENAPNFVSFSTLLFLIALSAKKENLISCPFPPVSVSNIFLLQTEHWIGLFGLKGKQDWKWRKKMFNLPCFSRERMQQDSNWFTIITHTF